MKQTLKWIGFLSLAGAIGLGMAFVFTFIVRAQPLTGVAQRFVNQSTAFPTSGALGCGSWSSANCTGVYTSTQPLSGYGYGPDMMGRGMGGMMGQGYRSDAWGYPGAGFSLTLDQAVESARQYLSAYGNPDLTLTEVMEFSENFYAEVEEESTGIHAFELLIDRYTGVVSPEPGPNMMWNTKYGHMGGMTQAPASWAGVGGWGNQQTGPMSVSSEQARDLAQQWLNASLPGTTTAEKADEFFGYYTIHVLKGDQISGMLSVNGFTGEVWYHTWHGDFIDMKEMEE